MADSMVMVVFKFTAGWLFNKGRSLAVIKLRNGGVLDQAICRLIVSDLDDIKYELRAQRRATLRESIDLFNSGIRSISVDLSQLSSPHLGHGPPTKVRRLDNGAPSERGHVETFVTNNSILTPNTRERFKEARQKAGSALGNAAQTTEDSILATYIQVMAQLLETEDPTRGIMFCVEYLQKLHSRQDVAQIFEDECYGSPFKLKSRKGRDIVWSVFHLNRVVFDVAQLVGGDEVFRELFIWPVINIGKNRSKEIDPLRDSRVDEVLRKEHEPEDRSVVWSFGQGGTRERHRLTSPSSIAIASEGYFLLVDDAKTTVFNSSGEYVKTLSIRHHVVLDIDVDHDGNIYMLVQMVGEQNPQGCSYKVSLFGKDFKLHHTFQLRNKYEGCKLAVNQHHAEYKKESVVVLKKGSGGTHALVEVYQTDSEGTFDGHFGESILMDAQDLVCAKNGHIYVLDRCHCGSEKKYIREFGARRYQLHSFEVDIDTLAVAFHRASEHIIIASMKRSELFLSIYNSKGVLEHTHPKIFSSGIVSSITVTTKGRIIVVLAPLQVSEEPQENIQGKVIVF